MFGARPYLASAQHGSLQESHHHVWSFSPLYLYRPFYWVTVNMDRLLNMHKIMKIIRLSRGGMERVPWSNRTFSSLCTRHPSGCGTTTSTVPTRFPHSSHRQALARHTSATADSLNKHRDNVTVTRSCEMTQGHAVPVPHCITTNSNTGIRCIGNNSIPYIRGCLSFRVPGLGIVHQPSVDRQYFTGSQVSSVTKSNQPLHYLYFS